MIRPSSSALLAAVIAASFVAAGPAAAQSSDSSGLLGRIFGGDDPASPTGRYAQASASDLIVRLDRLENQIRQLTGQIEQLQFRNQQLEQLVRRMQEDVDFRFQEQGRGRSSQNHPSAPRQETASVAPPRREATPPVAPPAVRASEPPVSSSQTSSDVFDPSRNPNAPGAPRPLGSIPGQPEDNEMGVGVPGGRNAGAPLDLSTLSDRVASEPPYVSPNMASSSSNPLPAPPRRNPSGTGAQHAMLPPNASPNDEFDLAYGYLLRKDYALAEQAFRDFLGKHPDNARIGDAHYWLGESQFQRQRYRDAAESFLTVSTKFEKSPKAPEALLRLGQSLAALQEKDAACATYAEVGRKFPNLPGRVKQAVDREQKRIRC